MANFKKLVEQIEQIPLSKIVELRVQLVKTGSVYSGICPFHDDHKIGSFNVNDSKHIIKCFSCGEATLSGIDFIKRVDKISWKEAVLRIGVELELLTEEEANNIGQIDYSSFQKEHLEKLKEASYKKDKAPDEMLNLVYKVISSEGDKLNGGTDVLTDEHRKYLHSRGITDDEIKKYGYFSMPNRRGVVKIVKKLSPFGFKNEDFKNIPGFYLNEEKGFFTLKPLKGIGIPIKNLEGLIIGIQVRRDGQVKPGEQRYFWWSSANEPLGSSPGSPIDIVLPKEIKTNSLFITEGHFKAAVIVKEKAAPVISVQGVGNWREVPKSIKKIPGVKKVLIAYDADMAYNNAVKIQAIKLGEAIEKAHPDIDIYYLIWDSALGKGIDDLILNKDASKRICMMKSTKFFSKIKEMKEETEEEFKRVFPQVFSKKN